MGTLTATNISGTLTTAAQPNITSVGTLANLTATSASITNLSGVGTLTATNISGTLTTAAQPTITSVGTVGNLTA
ncbi:hypothetical protein KC219_27135, partial [Mycobacterium tuberculosis]|nr:hypothetical protein [Mycobacterium tuberculosis]